MFKYMSGEEIKTGDQVTYHGEPGRVKFVVCQKVGEPATDWYLERFPGGGFMVATDSFGEVFLSEGDENEDLELVLRATG